MKEILLIGGSNIDFIGTSQNNIQTKVSNIGNISISFGGVMRNVCETLAMLGNKITFITALGNDLYGKEILKDLKQKKVKVYYPHTNLNTSTYLAINNNDHDMELAICDNKIIDYINEDYLKSLDKVIKKYDTVYIDSNLNTKTISYLLNTYTNIKFIAEGISPIKVIRYKENLDKLYMLKCNINEARALTNTNSDNKALVNELFNLGLKNVVITNKDKDIYYGINKKDINSIKVDKIDNIENTTGAGDAMFAGMIDKLNQGLDLKDAIIFGKKLSLFALTSKEAVSNLIKQESYKH